MNRILGVLITLMVLAAPMMAAAPALASENVAYDGETADSEDQTNTTYLATNSGLGNFTVKFTETQNISDGGSVFYPTNITADQVKNLSESDPGDIGVNIVDDGIYFNDTNANGDTTSEDLQSFEVVFNVSEDPPVNGSVPDAVNVSYDNWMENDTQLMADDDASEVHTYLVYATDKVVDVSYEFVGGDIEINESTGELAANGSDNTGKLVFHVTRNNTTYEGIPLSSLNFQVALNTTYFSDITETTDEDVDRIVLGDVASEDGDKVYTWSIVNPNNHTNTYDVQVNATVESGEANDTLVHTNVQNPDGGVESSGDTAYAHALGGGVISSPNFWDIISDLGVVGLGIGVVVIAGILWFLTRNQDPSLGMGGYAAYAGGWMMWAWVGLLAVGLTMVFDYLDPMGVTFDIWSDLVGTMGLPDMTPLIAGVVFVILALAMNVQNSNPMR